MIIIGTTFDLSNLCVLVMTPAVTLVSALLTATDAAMLFAPYPISLYFWSDDGLWIER
jgi:hypothetical protein